MQRDIWRINIQSSSCTSEVPHVDTVCLLGRLIKVLVEQRWIVGLYELFSTVILLGGAAAVTDKRAWPDVGKQLSQDAGNDLHAYSQALETFYRTRLR